MLQRWEEVFEDNIYKTDKSNVQMCIMVRVGESI